MTTVDHIQRIRDAMSARLGPLFEVHDVQVSILTSQPAQYRVTGLVTRGHTNSWSFTTTSLENMSPDTLRLTVDSCAKHVEQLYAKNDVT